MNNREYNLIVLGVLLIIAAGAVSIITGIGSQWELDRAYRDSQPSPVRSEWGQLRHTPEFMCEATIRQWLKECDK